MEVIRLGHNTSLINPKACYSVRSLATDFLFDQIWYYHLPFLNNIETQVYFSSTDSVQLLNVS